MTHPFLWFYNDGLLIFFRHQNTGCEGGFNHVYNKIIGQDIQLFHLVTCNICAPGNSIAEKERWRFITVIDSCRIVWPVCFFSYSADNGNESTFAQSEVCL